MSRRRLLQIGLGLLWAVVGLSSVVVWWFSDVPLSEVPQLFAAWLENVGWTEGIIVYLLLYLLRPLILFPSSIMGLTAGVVFGPWIGFAVTVTGELLGASLAFSLTRFLGRSWVAAHEWKRLADWDHRISENGVLTVCILRLTWLPFDSISYLCGLSGVSLRAFLAGTLLGGVTYFFSIALLGGSASVGLIGDVQLAGVTLTQRQFVLMIAGASFLVGAALAWSLRGRYRDLSASSD